jgi:hypothetical protein
MTHALQQSGSLSKCLESQQTQTFGAFAPLRDQSANPNQRHPSFHYPQARFDLQQTYSLERRCFL